MEPLTKVSLGCPAYQAQLGTEVLFSVKMSEPHGTVLLASLTASISSFL
jgi:hypothetical protein